MSWQAVQGSEAALEAVSPAALEQGHSRSGCDRQLLRWRLGRACCARIVAKTDCAQILG